MKKRAIVNRYGAMTRRKRKREGKGRRGWMDEGGDWEEDKDVELGEKRRKEEVVSQKKRGHCSKEAIQQGQQVTGVLCVCVCVCVCVSCQIHKKKKKRSDPIFWTSVRLVNKISLFSVFLFTRF